MSLRISSVAIFVALAGCGGPPEAVAPGNAVDREVGTGTPAGPPAERIACAIGNAAYADVCTIERTAASKGTIVTIRHPDGGFRRLRLAADGVVTAADGAVPAAVIGRTPAGTEIAIGDARYRLPTAR